MRLSFPPLSAPILPALVLLAVLGVDAQAATDPADAAIPRPTPQAACTLMRVTPNDAARQAFLDPLITLTHTGPSSGACGPITLRDADGAVVATTTVADTDWPDPRGGVVGRRTIEPSAPLRQGSTYRIHWNQQDVATFTVGTERRGAVVGVVDAPLQLPGLPGNAHPGKGDVDDVLEAFAESIAKGSGVKQWLFERVLRFELPQLAKPHARFGAHVRKLTYRSADANGNPLTLSALMVTPEPAFGGPPVDFRAMPVVIGQRGSTDNDGGAPSSAATSMVVPALVAAGRGHLFLAPDLIGVGDSADQPQAYLVAADTAAQTADLLRAARAFVAQSHQATIGPDLRLFGGSQGAHSTIASLPLLAREGTVRLVSAGQGPYDVQRTFQGSLLAAAGAPRDAYAEREELAFLPSHLRDVMLSHRAYGNYAFDPARVFDANGQILPSFLQAYRAGQEHDLDRHLAANSLVTGTQVLDLPLAQLQLYHFSQDPLVPAQNTVDLLAALQQPPARRTSAARAWA